MILTYDYVQAIEALKERWGYIKISSKSLTAYSAPKMIKPAPPQENFWPILDLGNALMSSAGLYYYGNVAGEPKLLGTLEEQGRQASRKMVAILNERGANDLDIDQTAARHLQFAAWIVARNLGITNNFVAKPDDELSAKKIEERLISVGKKEQYAPSIEAS